MVVLVTGAAGQLGQSLQHIAQSYPGFEWVFCDSTELDITSTASITAVITKVKPHYCINAAAYTAVDKAEAEPEKAHLINAMGPENLAKICTEHGTTLVHISTDFVFDGTQTTPYTETNPTAPLGVYGASKLAGEQTIQNHSKAYYIIRTSWVYSPFGNNFMKTMMRLAAERDSLSVVNDQIGTPTNALDLAALLIELIQKDSAMEVHPYGIYHYSNEGQCSWYEFAKAIFEKNSITIPVQPITTDQFPTPAKRPAYSVMDKAKIKRNFDIAILDWKESLLTL
ncbi:MAG: dTDP-4-dehydrorhamnose reductase [Flavobacterium sp.]|jgi:dTDP-4-dehydrorhamnose reductase|uniref:dTDP-4-dehydrorhamnose reductase n=3 Tax=Flavobacterium sp. TaxID=239 RepID=UPI0022CCBF4E|nr:dTDP-4-dehydrorhamnose reductase [Flavobacterium sp.]MCZ8168370.1 dTDP-4-dehydrorhamnose reductase [Flavobacterium sp.]MCZ8296672.1 dTDP-4-dehydrorhamnose reductase [Flavobacterium sp.]